MLRTRHVWRHAMHDETREPWHPYKLSFMRRFGGRYAVRSESNFSLIIFTCFLCYSLFPTSVLCGLDFEAIKC